MNPDFQKKVLKEFNRLEMKWMFRVARCGLWRGMRRAFTSSCLQKSFPADPADLSAEYADRALTARNSKLAAVVAQCSYFK